MEKYEEISESIEQNEMPEKAFFWKKDTIENVPEVEEHLHELGIENVDLRGAKEIWQKKIADAVETMYVNHPEIEGCIGSIRTSELPNGVYACAGPKMTENGIISEIQLSESAFAKSNLELQIVDMETENFKGERWFAGKGLDGILKHEMAHIMHLKLIADQEGISFENASKEDFEKLSEKYYHNAIAVTLCNDSMKELDISPRDIGKNLSTYGASDFGEFFAEAISECETSKNPRPLALKVYEKYNHYRTKKEVA